MLKKNINLFRHSDKPLGFRKKILFREVFIKFHGIFIVEKKSSKISNFIIGANIISSLSE